MGAWFELEKIKVGIVVLASSPGHYHAYIHQLFVTALIKKAGGNNNQQVNFLVQSEELHDCIR